VSLHPEVLKELERRRAANIRLLIQSPEAVGIGRQAIVRLGMSGLNPERGAVEDWLSEQDSKTEKLAADRHEQQLRAATESAVWAKRATWAAVILGGVSVLATIVFGVLSLRHP
jgi:hypothetical protein